MDMACDDAAPAPAAVSAQEVEVDLEQVKRDLLHFIHSMRQGKPPGVAE